MNDPSGLPRTIEEEVNRLIAEMPPENKEQLAEVQTEEGLIHYHFGLGQYIRNEYGLWAGNDELLKECGTAHADDASGVIIKALWSRLRREPDLLLAEESTHEQRVEQGRAAGLLLLAAADLGDLTQVQQLINLSVSRAGTHFVRLTQKDKDGNTALHLAAKNGHVQVAACILLSMRMEAPNIEVHAPNNDGKTPEDLATEVGWTQTAEMLKRDRERMEGGDG